MVLIEHKMMETNESKLTNMGILVLGRLSHTVQASLVSLMIAMRKVKPRYVHTGINQFFESGNIPASGSHGTDNLGFTGGYIRSFFDTLEGDVGAAEFGAGGGGLGLHR
jgi:hypothetical protein